MTKQKLTILEQTHGYTVTHKVRKRVKRPKRGSKGHGEGQGFTEEVRPSHLQSMSDRRLKGRQKVRNRKGHTVRGETLHPGQTEG